MIQSNSITGYYLTIVAAPPLVIIIDLGKKKKQ